MCEFSRKNSEALFLIQMDKIDIFSSLISFGIQSILLNKLKKYLNDFSQSRVTSSVALSTVCAGSCGHIEPFTFRNQKPDIHLTQEEITRLQAIYRVNFEYRRESSR